MDQRTTKEIVLPFLGATVVLYEYLVNGDYKSMEEELVQLIHPDFSGIDSKLPEEEQQKLRDSAIDEASRKVKGVAYLKQKQLVTKLLVKEVKLKDGEVVKDIPTFIYNLRRKDADFLDAEVSKIDEASAMTEDQKKNSQEAQ